MTRLWTRRTIDAPAEVLWALLTETEYWPAWGPTVRAGEIDGERFESGATGTVTTAVGIDLPFEITSFEPGVQWSWKVAGVPATDHRVEALGPDRCRVGFGVPPLVAPYLVVCQVALRRLDALATTDRRP